MNSIPFIKNDNGIPTLYVKDKPFFACCGEIHNSNASDLDYLKEHVWEKVKGLNMNSIIIPIYWELIEPNEGEYDFTLVNGIIRQARENQMHVIFLWFGLWKNAESMYVPSWIKKDVNKYFRVEKVNGQKINTISPFCEEAIEKDARAFSKLMAYIKEIDETENTVIMMQVENEIGLLGCERDYSKVAEDKFQRCIPEELMTDEKQKGSWKEVFAENAEEYFMAYYFAKAVERITQEGQKQYPLPCYANAWLRQYPWYVGSYPSGGPVTKVHHIWKKVAPSLFTLAPDIYVPYVAQVLDEYSSTENPLFVPEVRKDAVTASYCMYAFSEKNAIGYSPFGIEELTLPPEMIDKPPMEVMIALNIDPSAFDITGSKEYLAETYRLLQNLAPIHMQYRGTSHVKGFVKKTETDFGSYFRFEDYDVVASYSPKMANKPLAAGVIYELKPDEFLLCGMMCNLQFRPKAGENVQVEYLSIQEVNIIEGKIEKTRVLNGDEKIALRFQDVPACLHVKLYKY